MADTGRPTNASSRPRAGATSPRASLRRARGRHRPRLLPSGLRRRLLRLRARRSPPPSRTRSPRGASPARRCLHRNKRPLPKVECRMDSRVVTTKLRLPKPVVDLAGRAVGEVLVAQGVVTREKIDEALAVQAERGGRLGEVLVSNKACTE